MTQSVFQLLNSARGAERSPQSKFEESKEDLFSLSSGTQSLEQLGNEEDLGETDERTNDSLPPALRSPLGLRSPVFPLEKRAQPAQLLTERSALGPRRPLRSRTHRLGRPLPGKIYRGEAGADNNKEQSPD